MLQKTIEGKRELILLPRRFFDFNKNLDYSIPNEIINETYAFVFYSPFRYIFLLTFFFFQIKFVNEKFDVYIDF